MLNGVSELGAPVRLKMREEIQAAFVVLTVMGRAQRHDAPHAVATPERAVDEVRGMAGPARAGARDTGPVGDLRALLG